MPVLRRSIVNNLAKHVEAGDNATSAIEEVFVIEETGELCATYEYILFGFVVINFFWWSVESTWSV